MLGIQNAVFVSRLLDAVPFFFQKKTALHGNYDNPTQGIVNTEEKVICR